MSEPSYIELCLRSLPPAKQEAARKAFHDLTDGAPDDTMLSRLLIVLEATAAYGRTIPAEIATAMQGGIAALDARLGKVTSTSGVAHMDAAQLGMIVERISSLAESASEHRTLVESVRYAIEQVDRNVQRLRHARITAILLLMTAAAVVGAAGAVAHFKPRYEAARRVSDSVDYLAQRGIQLGMAEGENASVIFTVRGPITANGAEWTRDAKGRVTGARIVFAP